MGKLAMDRTDSLAADAFVKDELARGTRALRSVAPVIAHMLESDGAALVSDAVVARLRGMLSDIARQMLSALDHGESHAERFVDKIAGDQALIDHLYALALEAHLTERLEARASMDPVLSPLLQELIASDTPTTAELAMNVLAAQSRFCQSQRRMELPIGELPPELFASVLAHLETSELGLDTAQVAGAVSALRDSFDEGTARLGLLSRLALSLRGGAVAALDLSHAGFALFTSAIAALTDQDRDLAIFACHERQALRLAISLRAAGAEVEAIESQLALLGGTSALPSGIAAMSADRAQDLLAAQGRLARGARETV